MAITVGIFQMSGGGKSTSIVINPDGTYNPEDYKGMNPESHFIINLDKKTLPFPANMWVVDKHNYYEPDDFKDIKMNLNFTRIDL